MDTRDLRKWYCKDMHEQSLQVSNMWIRIVGGSGITSMLHVIEVTPRNPDDNTQDLLNVQFGGFFIYMFILARLSHQGYQGQFHAPCFCINILNFYILSDFPFIDCLPLQPCTFLRHNLPNFSLVFSI